MLYYFVITSIHVHHSSLSNLLGSVQYTCDACLTYLVHSKYWQHTLHAIVFNNISSVIQHSTFSLRLVQLLISLATHLVSPHISRTTFIFISIIYYLVSDSQNQLGVCLSNLSQQRLSDRQSYKHINFLLFSYELSLSIQLYILDYSIV